MPLQTIRIDQITVPQGRRRLDPAWVETLAGLFASQGQQSPIEVIARDGGYRLVFGAHRLAAAKLLGWPEIDAVVKSPEDFTDEAEIALREISENLARRELSVLDRAVDIARWREIYEAARGPVKAGRRSKSSQVVTISEDGGERFAASFSEAARKALGIDRMAVSRAMRIASISAHVRQAISLLPIANIQSELLTLAAEPHERQGLIVGLLTGEPAQAASVAEAIAILDRLPRPQPEPRWQRVASAFSLLKPAEQHSFFELHRGAIELWLEERGSR